PHWHSLEIIRSQFFDFLTCPPITSYKRKLFAGLGNFFIGARRNLNIELGQLYIVLGQLNIRQ
ncbi:MAG: hypothetical protein K0U49_00935, partial [Alphaproteobacteria bacterium]|nr:hypothetical protein [Alphaproteobacteria bacterium]